MNKRKKEKRFLLSVVEEFIMNSDPKYKGLRAGRIEIHRRGDRYCTNEGRFMLPEELYHKIRDLIDFYETDGEIWLNFSTRKEEWDEKYPLP